MKVPHPRGMHPPSLNTSNDQLQPTNNGDMCTKDDDDWRTPRSPLPPTVHWAQRPWRCAQVCNANRLPCNTYPHDDRRAPVAPPTTTVHQALGLWHHAQAHDADRETPRGMTHRWPRHHYHHCNWVNATLHHHCPLGCKA